MRAAKSFTGKLIFEFFKIKGTVISFYLPKMLQNKVCEQEKKYTK